MRICGLKVTHDGGIALIEDGRLIFSVEQEKIANNRRYHPIRELDVVQQTLRRFGFTLADIDQFVIDGWDGNGRSSLSLLSSGEPTTLIVAPYIEGGDVEIMQPITGHGLVIDGQSFNFTSYPHVAGHISSSYCTSQFAKSAEPAYCLVWDGAIFPRLYYVDPKQNTVQLVTCLFPLIGHAYAAVGEHFGPYKRDMHSLATADLGIAGKLMAYIAKGRSDPGIVERLHEIYTEQFLSDSEDALRYRAEVVGKGMGIEPSLKYLHGFLDACAQASLSDRHNDILASFHVFLEQLLISGLSKAIADHSQKDGPRNLCIAGGCALNIKWNSAIRGAGIFDAVWVPPFPNDSGSAIGAACCAMITNEGFRPLDWDVYRGPALLDSAPPPGWRTEPCSMEQLARYLAAGEPVVFLSGRAELGPRALGARSILAAATSYAMKDLLNDLKLREHFRPVAPICLEDRAPEMFEPGTPDPYMLFDHQTRHEWQERIPAIVHLDGSARLQTVDRKADLDIARALIAYERLTGLPLLCNTSANHHGRGFFPDVVSACEWGKIGLVWADGTMYVQENLLRSPPEVVSEPVSELVR